jgi:hypothetical protein
VFRLIGRKIRKRPGIGDLCPEEIEYARNFIFKRIQSNVYRQEVEDLRAGRAIEKSSDLIKLSSYLDPNGILRVGGRIDKAPLPLNARHPIILPRKERVTELILSQLHRENPHLSAEQLHHEARKEYWIPKGKMTAKRVYDSCYLCRRKTPPDVRQRLLIYQPFA